MVLGFRGGLVGVCLATLAGCSTLSPAGMIAASRLDPQGTPPDQIALAVGVPETIRLASGDARLRLSFAGGTEASTVVIEETAPLELTLAGTGGPAPQAAG